MYHAELTSRIIHSQLVLYGWREVSPGGRLQTTLSMIAEEIDILGELALDNPESAAKLDELAKCLVGRLSAEGATPR